MRAALAATTPMPAASDFIADFDPSTVAGADGANVASWTDSKSSILAGTQIGTLPILKLNQDGGKPCVRFGGAGGLKIASPAAIRTAIDSRDFTILIAFKNRGVPPNGFGAMFAAYSGGNPFFYYANGTGIAKYIDNQNAIPHAGQTSFTTLGSSSFKTSPIHGSTNEGQSFYVNGGAVATIREASIGTGGNDICIGTDGSLASPFVGDIYRIWIWRRALAPAEYTQAEKRLRELLNQPYPWGGVDRFTVFFGDSGVAGYGASDIINLSPSRLAAQTLGLEYGQYHVLGIFGVTLDDMALLAPSWVDPLPAIIGKEVALVSYEWYNQPDATITKAAAFLTARKAVSGIRTIWGTSYDSSALSSPQKAARAAYNAANEALYATPGQTLIDVFMPLHLDVHIGVDGSYALYSSAGDSVHLVDATYPYLGGMMVDGVRMLAQRPVASGLTHWWPLNSITVDFTAGTAKEMIAGVNGAITGLASALPLDFDGNDKIATASSASLAGASFSYAVTVNAASLGGYRACLEYDRSGNNWMFLGTHDSVAVWRVSLTAGNDAASILATGEDDDLVGTYDATTQRAFFYRNGLADLAYTASPPTPTTSALRIGLNASDGEGWIGTMTDSARWNRALSAQEVAERFARKKLIVPVDMMLSTDVTDLDDLMALASAAIMHRAGIINLRSVDINSSAPYAAPCADVILRKYGLTGVPIGAYKDEAGARVGETVFTQQIVNRFAASVGLSPTATRSSYPAASVVIADALNRHSGLHYCSIGLMTNIAAALAANATLFNAQISRITAMLGAADGVTIEFNASSDAQAAHDVFANATVPIDQVPLETGATSAWSTRSGADPLLDPLKYAQDLTGVVNRPAWDFVALWLAGRGLTNHLTASATGKVTVNASTGVSTFSSGASPNLHRQISLTNDPSQMALIAGAIVTSLELTG